MLIPGAGPELATGTAQEHQLSVCPSRHFPRVHSFGVPGAFAGQLEGVDETSAALASSPVQQLVTVGGSVAAAWLCHLMSDTQPLPRVLYQNHR